MTHAHASPKRRSSVEWALRILAAVVVGTIGYLATAQSFALALADRQVERAHRWAPHNARITADLAYKRFLADISSSNWAASERLAATALRGDATAVSAVTTLGLVAQSRGDIAGARRLFAYSERLSRRDLSTQLWLIEDAVVRENIPEALRHYDIALRTKHAASDLLFPVLAAASNEPAIAGELVKTLAAKPIWTEPFLSFLADNSSAPGTTAGLFVRLRRANVAIPEAAQTKLVNVLVVGNQVDAAWNYYATLRPGVDRRQSRDADFAAMLDTPSLLDWVALRDIGPSASIQRAGQGGVFEFSAPSTVGGRLLQQMQFLPPGRYRLDGRSADIDQPADSRPYWALLCGADGRELGRLDMPNSAENEGRFAGHFVVPAGCPAQNLVLIARPSNALSGLSGQISHVLLRPEQ